jgi:WS/DGAT/MGAT family acyltransferase
MHTMKIYMMDVRRRPGVNWYGIHDRIEAILDQVPMLRRRPVYVPMGLHHPVMVDDPDFDLEYHICKAALPEPGGMRELEAMVAQIGSHPLDQHRPLWELWILEGMADGRLACVLKIHHALADGMASVAYITRAWTSGAAGDDLPPPRPWVPEKIPTARRLVFDAMADHFKHDARNLPVFIRNLWCSMRGMRAHARNHPSPMMAGIKGQLPRCRWNLALSPKRSFATTQFSLDEVRLLKDCIGGTVNDVVLALVAGSLRTFLLGHRELPDQPLHASIPVSTEETGSIRESGNQTSAIATLLHVNIADPLHRYNAIRESTDQGKAELDVMGKDTFGMLMHYIPPILLRWSSQRKYRNRIADEPGFTPMSNLTISNVPGPDELLTAKHNALSDLYSIGPLVEGIGLNVTVWSYAGNLNFSIMGCKKALPDIHKITDGMALAMDELRALADPDQGVRLLEFRHLVD